MNIFKRLQKAGSKSDRQIDPYIIGEILGPQAFTEGDWVVIRSSENRPAKVRRRELIGVVRVILGNESDPVYAETCYYPSQLGYPLTKDLWSKSQKKRYEECQQKNKSEKQDKVVKILAKNIVSYTFLLAIVFATLMTMDSFIPTAREYSHNLWTAVQERLH